MLLPYITAQGVVDVLNDMLKRDYHAVEALMRNRVYCNAALADHPSIQTSSVGAHSVGLLGILNGLFGTIEEGPKAGFGPITMEADEHTGVILRFRVTEA